MGQVEQSLPHLGFMSIQQRQHLDALDQPARYLHALKKLEGVPIVATLEEQKKTPWPHLMIYPNGSVRIWIGPKHCKDWNPLVPLRKQLGTQ
jgi:hypothetical protein